MNINKKLYIIFFVLIGFVLNIIFYLYSDNYRYFMQSLKYDNKKYKVDDRFKIKLKNDELDNNINNESIFSGLREDFGEKQENEKLTTTREKDLKQNENEDDNKEKAEVVFINQREKLRLTNIEKNILESLKEYKLKKIELQPRLFDLTGEYPDDYFEYYSDNLTLYFFGNKQYNEIKDIFEVLTYELPFTINEVNNFGNKSFFINLDTLFEDSYVRIVIEKSNRTFGIKIKRTLYNEIKDNLGIIFKN